MLRQIMWASVDQDRLIAGNERWPWRLCANLLTLFGSAVLLIGVSLVLLLPSLLSEDLRFIGASPVRLETAAPHLDAWPAHVSRVIGGYYCGNRNRVQKANRCSFF